ncbi:cation transporter [Salinimicrobium soli]|uniref:cation transporter n=1 Tax=Salinimicrobium soli TaxID=1254399 RepID=UPI003AAB1E2D
MTTFTQTDRKYYNLALGLAILTIVYNVLEGLVSMYFGYEDESLALFGFGADSFIEVISGLGIAHMVIRIKQNPHSSRDPFEKTALRITGVAFYLLTAGLIISSIYNIWTDHQPETTFWGVVISAISILTMGLLVWAKRKAGRKLASEPILADANCTLVCLYMSVVLLISSGVYELSGIGFIDSLGGLGLAWFSFSEGKECFEKIKSDKYCSC